MRDGLSLTWMDYSIRIKGAKIFLPIGLIYPTGDISNPIVNQDKKICQKY
jgi:hypothetical protein